MNTIKFNNADKLVAYCTENNLLAGQVWVDHNPYGDGERTLLWYSINLYNKISTNIFNQHYIKGVDKGVDYAQSSTWHNSYKGTFELVLPYNQFTKPEVYAVGDTVEVLENVREIGNWEDVVSENKKSMIGNCYEILGVNDDYSGIHYGLKYDDNDKYIFPHDCVRKVENPPREMTLEEIEKELGYKIKLIN